MNIFLPRPKSNVLLVLAMVCLCVSGGRARAQAFSILHSFNSPGNGAYPDDTLVLSNGVLYGVTGSGGGTGSGNIFRMNSDGSGYTNLYSFSNTPDGSSPYAGLILSGNTLYGTTIYGGASNDGMVFRINTDGTGFTNLHSFVFADGKNPYGGLVLVGNTLYGTTAFGGLVFANSGTVFQVNTDGTGFAVVHSFTALNGEAGSPYSAMIASGNTLYGTTIGGGAGGGFGAVFSIDIPTSTYTTLHSFPGANNEPQTEGIYPYAPLVLSGNTLYGTAYQGGDSGQGLVYSLTTDGLNYTKLYSFTADPSVTNSDGALPNAGLVLAGDTLYGTTIRGGAGYGTLFAVRTNGTGFTNLHSLAVSDGIYPYGGLVFANNILYGTTSQGDSLNNGGTLFRFSLINVVPPKLTIGLSGTNVVLSWPTNATGFILQFSTNLTAPIIWTTNASAPDILNGYYVVTNGSGPQKFYRLSNRALP
jgi:uncharacterized repeat protein (TIGR03803 family)